MSVCGKCHVRNQYKPICGALFVFLLHVRGVAAIALWRQSETGHDRELKLLSALSDSALCALLGSCQHGEQNRANTRSKHTEVFLERREAFQHPD